MGDLVQLIMKDRMTVIKKDTTEEVHPIPVFGPQLIIKTAVNHHPTLDIMAEISKGFAPDGANAFVLGASYTRQDCFRDLDKERDSYTLCQSIQYYRI